MTTKNISESEMNRGVMEQNRLIDTLKTIVGVKTKQTDTLEIIVKKYFSFNFLPLKKLTSSSDVIYFMNQRGIPEFTYSPEMKALRVKGREFNEAQDMFNIDEDALEEIFKSWMKDNFDVDITYIDYYNN